MIRLINRRAALCGAGALALAPMLGQAEDKAFPNRPIRMVMPWPPGGGGDTQTRLVTQPLGELLGQPLVVDNKPGANGLLGTRITIAAPPDGYTLVFGVSGQIILGPLLSKEPTFDPLHDLVPVSGLSSQRFFLAVSTGSGFNSLQDLIAAAKASPGKIAYGTPGVGALSHIAAAQLAQLTGTEMTHIPYQSASHVTRALIAGDVQCTFVVGGDLSGQLKAGTMRALAVTGEGRSKILPEVPTMREQGVDGWMPDNVWFGFFGPARLPAATLDTLHAGMTRVLARPDVVERLRTIYFAEPWPVDSPEFSRVLALEKQNFAAVLKSANISAT